MVKIVLFNGPPSSGKDTLANQLVLRIPRSEVVKFAAPLKTVATHLYCDGDSRKFYELDQADKKNTPHPTFLGKSCRQVQIDISEVYMKPMHGKHVFGEFLKRTINRKVDNTDIFFVSDSGFREEAEVLVEEFGAQNILLVRLKREGFDYKNDSRDYIDLKDLEVKQVNVINIENDINATLKEVEKVVKEFLGA